MKLLLKLKGGAGSGHRGHRGIPGKRGGSLPGAGGGGVLAIDHEKVIQDYKVWSPHRGGGSPSKEGLEAMLRNAVKDPKDIAHNVKRRGILSHKQLQRLYEKGGYSDSAVRGAMVIPERGPFEGIPLAVNSPSIWGKGGAHAWDCSPLFKEGKGKGKRTGWHMSIPKEELK